MSGTAYLATLVAALSAVQNPSTQSPATTNPSTQNPQNQSPSVPTNQAVPSYSTMPGTPAGGATSAPAAPPTPTFVNAGVNQPLAMGSLSYRVLGVRQGLSTYMLEFDQRKAKLTPGYKSDRLVVVDLEVTNTGTMPAEFTAISPALADSDGELTDRPQWDVRQQSFVKSNTDTGEAALRFYSSYLSPDTAGTYGDVSDAVKVAPQGKVRFALVFSEPANAHVGKIRFETGQMYGAAPWTVGQVNLSNTAAG